MSILSLNPIPAARPCRKVQGEPIDFQDVVRDAGMVLCVSGGMPQVLIADIDRDRYVPRPGHVIRMVPRRFLPEEPRERAREIIRRLAYAHHDWAAREVAARYHRDLALLKEGISSEGNRMQSGMHG